jgi:AraC family transcriptional regulator
MEPRIEMLAEKKLIGKNIHMSIAKDRTFELWSSFMPERKNMKNVIDSDLISMQVYDQGFDFKDFTPDIEFEKWATVEVSDHRYIPDGMSAYTLRGGLYAVFHYKGRPSNFAEAFKYIFYNWFPASPYEVDQREHFEILGDKYKNDDPDSEEDIWVPIKPRKTA